MADRQIGRTVPRPHEADFASLVQHLFDQRELPLVGAFAHRLVEHLERDQHERRLVCLHQEHVGTGLRLDLESVPDWHRHTDHLATPTAVHRLSVGRGRTRLRRRQGAFSERRRGARRGPDQRRKLRRERCGPGLGHSEHDTHLRPVAHDRDAGTEREGSNGVCGADARCLSGDRVLKPPRRRLVVPRRAPQHDDLPVGVDGDRIGITAPPARRLTRRLSRHAASEHDAGHQLAHLSGDRRVEARGRGRRTDRDLELAGQVLVGVQHVLGRQRRTTERGVDQREPAGAVEIAHQREPLSVRKHHLLTLVHRRRAQRFAVRARGRQAVERAASHGVRHPREHAPRRLVGALGDRQHGRHRRIALEQGHPREPRVVVGDVARKLVAEPLVNERVLDLVPEHEPLLVLVLAPRAGELRAAHMNDLRLVVEEAEQLLFDDLGRRARSRRARRLFSREMKRDVERLRSARRGHPVGVRHQRRRRLRERGIVVQHDAHRFGHGQIARSRHVGHERFRLLLQLIEERRALGRACRLASDECEWQ